MPAAAGKFLLGVRVLEDRAAAARRAHRLAAARRAHGLAAATEADTVARSCRIAPRPRAATTRRCCGVSASQPCCSTCTSLTTASPLPPSSATRARPASTSCSRPRAATSSTRDHTPPQELALCWPAPPLGGAHKKHARAPPEARIGSTHSGKSGEPSQRRTPSALRSSSAVSRAVGARGDRLSPAPPSTPSLSSSSLAVAESATIATRAASAWRTLTACACTLPAQGPTPLCTCASSSSTIDCYIGRRPPLRHPRQLGELFAHKRAGHGRRQAKLVSERLDSLVGWLVRKPLHEPCIPPSFPPSGQKSSLSEPPLRMNVTRRLGTGGCAWPVPGGLGHARVVPMMGRSTSHPHSCWRR